jgi:hypothetical protein
MTIEYRYKFYTVRLSLNSLLPRVLGYKRVVWRYGNELMFAWAISVNRTSWHFPGRTSADNNTAPISPGPLVLQLLSRLFRCVHRISGAILRFLPATTMPFRTASVYLPHRTHVRFLERFESIRELFQAKFRNAAEIFRIPLYCSAVNRLFSRLQNYRLLIIKRER